MKIASLDFVQRRVDSPLHFKAREWLQIAARTFTQINKDNVPVVAAGVAFFALLSMFPLISAMLSIYGYFADIGDVQAMAEYARPLMPEEAWNIVSGQVEAVVNAPNSSLSLRIVISLLVALYSAGAGIRALLRAMNVAYGEDEKRNIVMFYLTAVGMTLGLFLFVYTTLAIVAGIPIALSFLNLDATAEALASTLPWVALIFAFGFGAFIIYRFGPSRRPARKRWVMPGVIFTTISWLFLSWGFSLFVRHFGNYNETYGGLSAVIVLLLWFWLTAMTVIMGAELNAEMERQTLADTTRGPDRPIGTRRASMSDYLTLAMRRMFPERFPHARSVLEQAMEPDASAPDVAKPDAPEKVAVEAVAESEPDVLDDETLAKAAETVDPKKA